MKKKLKRLLNKVKVNLNTRPVFEERREVLKFKALLTPDVYNKLVLKHPVMDIGRKMEPGDTLSLTYRLNVDYLNCITHLLLFLDLLANGVAVDSEELEHSYCLAENLFTLLKEVKARKSNTWTIPYTITTT